MDQSNARIFPQVMYYMGNERFDVMISKRLVADVSMAVVVAVAVV